jgi:OFA family oxalate/formate antiporter-like MFS transporter
LVRGSPVGGHGPLLVDIRIPKFLVEGRRSMSRGWSVVLAGFVINLALGILYTWSVISKAIPDAWGWTEQQKSWPFSICCLVFSLMMVPAGRLQDKISPRLVASLGGILVGLGMIMASRDTSYFNYVLGFGVLTGTGIGFGYASATPPAVKWFPAAKTGLIAGLVVSGFGLASVYAAPLTNWLVKLEGGVPNAMFILGVAFLLTVVLLAQLLRIPPAGYVPPGFVPPAANAVAKKEDFQPTEMLRTNQFYLLWFMYACGAGAGLMIISKLATLADKQAGVKLGFVLVASLAIGNGAGRIVAGMLSDRLGRKPTIVGCLLIQALLMIVLTFETPGSILAAVPVFALVSALIGANYGANLALYPSVTKDYYGLKNFGVNYGLVFTAWGVGGFVLPLLAGRLYDAYGSFKVSCYLAASLLVVAAFVAIMLRAPHHDAQKQVA